MSSGSCLQCFVYSWSIFSLNQSKLQHYTGYVSALSQDYLLASKVHRTFSECFRKHHKCHWLKKNANIRPIKWTCGFAVNLHNLSRSCLQALLAYHWHSCFFGGGYFFFNFLFNSDLFGQKLDYFSVTIDGSFGYQANYVYINVLILVRCGIFSNNLLTATCKRQTIYRMK